MYEDIAKVIILIICSGLTANSFHHYFKQKDFMSLWSAIFGCVTMIFVIVL